MRAWYTAAILVLGLTMASTLVYSLAAFPNRSITNDLLNYMAYRWLLTACLGVHFLVWGLYFHAHSRLNPAAADWGYVALVAMTVGWLGLVTNLEGTTHVVFVAVFCSAYFVKLLTLCHLVYDQDLEILLRIAMIVALVSNILMLILFDRPSFYIPEHISFITYSLFFTAFFCAQDYAEWGAYCALEAM